MEGFYAGRTECKIRRTKIPVVYCDLLSAYPTCNALQRNWDILTAESLSRKHTTHVVASSQLRDWLERIPLDLVSYHTGIDRHTLRSVRDGNPARREVLLAVMELRKLWINAEQCGALKSARDAIRRSRRDYKNGGALRDLMLQEKKAKRIG
jgi:hypothetical protein